MTPTLAPPKPPNHSRERMAELHLLSMEIRSEKAEVKRKLREGEWNLSQAFLHPPRSAKLGEILQSARGLGPEKVRVILARTSLSATKPIADLTSRQKRELYEFLYKNHGGAWGGKPGDLVADEEELGLCQGCGEPVREGRSKHKGCSD